MSVNKFINDANSVVEDSLAGLVTANSEISLLEGKHRVLLRRDITNGSLEDRVAVVSGGGAGHEPAHACYVGQGLLDAVVVGSVFCSPPVASIVAMLQTVLQYKPKGILVIVKNYMGDRLNFGLAIERTLVNLTETPISMFLVSDDQVSYGRGVAGTVLVHKIAGALANRGCSLSFIIQYLRCKIAPHIRSVGLRVNNDNTIELGVGIHGETGTQMLPLTSAIDSIQLMLDVLFLRPVELSSVVVLLNNLGGTSVLELGILSKEIFHQLSNIRKISIERMFVGTFMSSLDMAGVSVTLLFMNNEDVESNVLLLSLLDADVSTSTAWIKASIPPKVSAEVYSVPICQPLISCCDSERDDEMSVFGSSATHLAINFACHCIVSCESMLNTLDSECGDGDCGTTLKRGALILLDEAPFETTSFSKILRNISSIAEVYMGGTSGALYSIFFEAAATACHSSSSHSIMQAMMTGLDAVCKYGGAKPGDRTMIDALQPALLAAGDSLKEKPDDIIAALQAAAESAESGAVQTQHMTAKVGRAAGIISRGQSQPDAGAHAIGIIARAIVEAFKKKAAEMSYLSFEDS